MKVSVLAFAFLTFTSAVISTATAHEQCTGPTCKNYLRTGTTFEIAQQYSVAGKFGGVRPGTTGTVLDIARDSMDYFGALELYASAWRVPPAVARGE